MVPSEGASAGSWLSPPVEPQETESAQRSGSDRYKSREDELAAATGEGGVNA